MIGTGFIVGRGLIAGSGLGEVSWIPAGAGFIAGSGDGPGLIAGRVAGEVSCEIGAGAGAGLIAGRGAGDGLIAGVETGCGVTAGAGTVSFAPCTEVEEPETAFATDAPLSPFAADAESESAAKAIVTAKSSDTSTAKMNNLFIITPPTHL